MLNALEPTKRQRRQTTYESVVKKVNKNSKNFLAVSVMYYWSWNPIVLVSHLFAYIIALSAILKRREPWVHSCYIYRGGDHPRVLEAVGSGATHYGLYKYFRPSFHGRVDIHIIPATFTKAENRREIKYVEKKLLGKRYSIVKAMRAWFDLGEEQKDIEDADFCSDNVLDAYERRSGRKLIKNGNNAEVEPSELRAIFIERDFKLLCRIDSKKI
jgi:hypothetical protein